MSSLTRTRGAGEGGAKTRSPINPKSKLGLLYRVLREASPRWMSNWTLTTKCQVAAISTRLSELRTRLPEDEVIEAECHRDELGRVRWHYRIVFRRRTTQGLLDGGESTLPPSKPVTSPGSTRRFLEFESGGR